MPFPILPPDFRKLYDRFDLPLMGMDCGKLCAVNNPQGIPFCCDICEAVPVAYFPEWEYLRAATDLWHIWRGDECPADPTEPASLRDETPEHMLLLACQGVTRCERPNRALSCRQFPFFPYIASDGRFIGLAYHWDFERMCWVISNLGAVSAAYRQAFVSLYDELLIVCGEDYESYAALSEDMRADFAARKRRIPLVHRNGGYYLISPRSERLERVPAERLPRFGVYRLPMS